MAHLGEAFSTRSLRSGLIALGIFSPLKAAAFAAEPAPRWEVGEICATSTLGAQCPRIESQNRRSLLLRWEAIPAGDRTACKTSIEESGKPSYKLMLNCIEERQLKSLEAAPHAFSPPRNDS